MENCAQAADPQGSAGSVLSLAPPRTPPARPPLPPASSVEHADRQCVETHFPGPAESAPGDLLPAPSPCSTLLPGPPSIAAPPCPAGPAGLEGPASGSHGIGISEVTRSALRATLTTAAGFLTQARSASHLAGPAATQPAQWSAPPLDDGSHAAAALRQVTLLSPLRVNFSPTLMDSASHVNAQGTREQAPVCIM